VLPGNGVNRPCSVLAALVAWRSWPGLGL
jgi:hypothetical protein